jgi:hypothetical protein
MFMRILQTNMMMYFVLVFLLIAIAFTIVDVRRGCIYYLDILDVLLFIIILAMWIVSQEKTLSWLTRYRGKVIYPLFAVITIIPPLLSLPAFRIVWKGESTMVPTVFVVLWGSTFVLSSTLLWLGAPIKTPLLIMFMMTLPVRVTLTRRIRTISPIPGMMARMKRIKNWFPTKET